MRKKIIIISSIFLSIILLYFVGGIIASNIVFNNIFDKRFSDENTLLLPNNRIYKNRDDYINLKNRIEYDFYSGNNKLKGYYYKSLDSKGLVISAHGMTSQSDSTDLAYQNYFVSNGYSLFSFDFTSHGKSQGNSLNGLQQAAFDVKACYDFIFENNLYENNIILIGHSLGGYGVAAALNLGVKANYLITFSAFDNPYDTMIRYSKNAVGDIINLTLPTFYITSKLRYGDNIYLSASEGIKKSNIKALVIHGSNDNNIPIDDSSLLSHVTNLENVNKEILVGVSHNTPWFSDNAINYVNNIVKPKIEELKDDEDKLNEYINSIDKNRTSELREYIFDKIYEFIRS